MHKQLFFIALLFASTFGNHMDPLRSIKSRYNEMAMPPKVQEQRNEHRKLETIQVELKMTLALSYFELYSKVGNSTKWLLFIADNFDILI